MIAGEHAQAARVDREALVPAVLGAEIGDQVPARRDPSSDRRASHRGSRRTPATIRRYASRGSSDRRPRARERLGRTEAQGQAAGCPRPSPATNGVRACRTASPSADVPDWNQRVLERDRRAAAGRDGILGEDLSVRHTLLDIANPFGRRPLDRASPLRQPVGREPMRHHPERARAQAERASAATPTRAPAPERRRPSHGRRRASGSGDGSDNALSAAATSAPTSIGSRRTPRRRRPCCRGSGSACAPSRSRTRSPRRTCRRSTGSECRTPRHRPKSRAHAAAPPSAMTAVPRPMSFVDSELRDEAGCSREAADRSRRASSREKQKPY